MKYVGIGFLVTILLLAVISVLTVISMHNSAVRMEKGIQAQYEQNQNRRSAYVNSIAEAVQIPKMYKDDFKEIVTAALQGRYGKNGSQATFQWLKEHNINFDSSVYKKLQTMIEAGREKFAHEQKLLIDKKRQYETELQTFPGSLVYPILGFPRINLDDYKIVKSADNEAVFNKGVESPLKLR